MHAAVLEAYGEPLAIRDRPSPTPPADGVVLAVEACGICRSDWHAWQGHGEWADDQVPLGQVLGHEPVGRIVEVGQTVDDVTVGDRVAVPFNLGDGTCSACRRGHGNVCAEGYALGFESRLPGAFAEYLAVPHAAFNVAKLPPGVDPAAVAGLGCRYVTAYHALAHRVVRDLEGAWVAVHGCGGLGLSAVQIAAALGARVVAVDVRAGPLRQAATLGAAATIDAGDLVSAGGPEAAATVNASTETVPDAVEAITDGGVDVSIDALGRAETCRNSLGCLRPLGTHLQLGLTTDAERGEVPIPIDELTRWERSFLGSRGMPPSRYPELLETIEAGALEPGALVTRRVALEDVSDRLAAMSRYETRGIEVVTSF